MQHKERLELYSNQYCNLVDTWTIQDEKCAETLLDTVAFTQ